MSQWHLQPDGAAVTTHSSRLLPVIWQGRAAMLKIATADEERIGGALMQWWDGEGAARVYAAEGPALLLERAKGGRSLRTMACGGEDAAATRIISETVTKLQAPRQRPLPNLMPLQETFVALLQESGGAGDVVAACANMAREMLADQRDVCVLHGDIHHDNILDFDSRGWLAIDPKGVIGDRVFDYANLFCNPDRMVATDPRSFRKRLGIVAEIADIEPIRLLRWLLAWCGLSAVWHMAEDGSPDLALEIAAFTLAEIQ